MTKELGCEFSEHNHIKTDQFQKTTEPGIFACGDNTTMLRSLFNALAKGGLAGVMAGKELITAEFNTIVSL
ncbi:FAD-dependent oxidoreductase [Pedobacter lithocola]|uniref:FAD-dependent oxidoreductase n=1 Tax=Pedobacter lithocola TaxID=1908239 RepID=A0ABV8PCJ5_9SPHI